MHHGNDASVLSLSDRRRSPSEVIAAILKLSNDITTTQRQVRHKGDLGGEKDLHETGAEGRTRSEDGKMIFNALLQEVKSLISPPICS